MAQQIFSPDANQALLTAPAPEPEPATALTPRTPLVFVPGITGSKLRERMSWIAKP